MRKPTLGSSWAWAWVPAARRRARPRPERCFGRAAKRDMTFPLDFHPGGRQRGQTPGHHGLEHGKGAERQFSAVKATDLLSRSARVDHLKASTAENGHRVASTTVPFRVPAVMNLLKASRHDVLRERGPRKPDPYIVNDQIMIVKFVNYFDYILC